jgi:hypothetical protein
MTNPFIKAKNSTRTATITVAASNASLKSKQGADYVCDGTNDHLEINAAFAALPSGIGGRVLLTEGTFNISASIVPTSLSTLEGQGWGTKLVTNCSGHTISFTANDVVLKNFMMDGTPQTYTTFNAKSGIYQGNCMYCTIEGIFFVHMRAAAIQIMGTTGNHQGQSIKGCKFLDCRTAILLNNYGEYVRISDCNVVGAAGGAEGINIYGAGNVAITNTMVTDCVGAGLNIEPTGGGNSTKITVSNSHFNHNLIGILVNNMSKVSIMNCNAIANNQEGIKLMGCIHCSVIGGTVGANGATTNNTYDEIKLTDATGSIHSTYNVIQGVIIDSYVVGFKARYSIYEDTNCNYNLFAHNTGIIGQTGSIYKVGANSILNNNIIA